jgi:hypothetical protein
MGIALFPGIIPGATGLSSFAKKRFVQGPAGKIPGKGLRGVKTRNIVGVLNGKPD